MEHKVKTLDYKTREANRLLFCAVLSLLAVMALLLLAPSNPEPVADTLTPDPLNVEAMTAQGCQLEQRDDAVEVVCYGV